MNNTNNQQNRMTYGQLIGRVFASWLPVLFIFIFAGIGSYLVISSHAATPCTTTISSGLAAAINSAGAGDTICLNAGSYGNVSLSNVSKASDVTIEPVSGAVASVTLTIAASSHLNFQSLTIGGLDLTGASKNITVAHSKFTGGTELFVTGTNTSILIDSNTFSNISRSTDDYEGRVQIEDSGSGLQVSNNYFSGGCSDGIQMGSSGGDIGPGNEFTGIQQGGCDPLHVDPLQIYGADNVDIHDNYFHGNSTGIMAPDGGDNETITGNVFDSPNYPPLTMGSSQGDIITHNTTNGTFRIFEGNSGQDSRGDTVRDNVIGNGFSINKDGSSPFSVEDYNIIPGGGGSGAHDLSGNPTFVGGANPSTLAGWQLTAGSVGVGKASDGLNIGALSVGTVPPPDSTPPTVSVSAPTAGSTVSGTTSVTASASDNVAVASVQFKLDGANLGSVDTASPYTVSWNTTTASNGSHVLTAMAIDTTGNSTTSSPVTVTVSNSTADTTPPVTSISSGPASSTTATSASFSFTGTDNVTPAGSLTFQCSLDGASYASCSSPKAYSGLAVGSHTFNVKATDSAGNTDATPASQAWTITSTATVTGDLDGDGHVTGHDLSIFLAHYGTNYAPAEFDGGTIVEGHDLSILLSGYGK